MKHKHYKYSTRRSNQYCDLQNKKKESIDECNNVCYTNYIYAQNARIFSNDKQNRINNQASMDLVKFCVKFPL